MATNTKILVNFTSKKIIHTNDHAGSTNYKHLVKLGFEPVGTIKGQIQAYWNDQYFDFKVKYPKSSMETGGSEPIIHD